jgi:hypothetical protein
MDHLRHGNGELVAWLRTRERRLQAATHRGRPQLIHNSPITAQVFYDRRHFPL